MQKRMCLATFVFASSLLTFGFGFCFLLELLSIKEDSLFINPFTFAALFSLLLLVLAGSSIFKVSLFKVFKGWSLSILGLAMPFCVFGLPEYYKVTCTVESALGIVLLLWFFKCIRQTCRDEISVSESS